MRYIKPDYMDHFYCTGESCIMPCPAPADMTWTRTLGDLCESGVSMACPQGARLILLHEAPTTFQSSRDNAPAADLSGISGDQLALMLDARKTMDIILQNRSLPFRSDLMLSLIYGYEFEPMISSDSRYAYDEMDWGFTEQPYRQLSYAQTSQGNWEMKRSDLLHVLFHLHKLCGGDEFLRNQLEHAIDMIEPIGGDAYRTLRDAFDAYMQPREYLFENLMVYDIHRHFLAHSQDATVLTGVKFSVVSFAVIRCMAARLYRDTGFLTDEAFVALCRHWSRCVEESPKIHRELEALLETDPLFTLDVLQRMLWQ